jgi:energy-coupling factor transporter ATP-binding protein EcfA2
MATVTEVAALVRPGARVGIDGRDAAGKTSFAEALRRVLPGATLVSIDSFHRPAEERVDYYRDAFDLPAFVAAVEGAAGTVVAEGAFLFRPELDALWDVRVRIEVDPGEQWRRGVARGDRVERYDTRYRPAHAAYEAAVRPAERADVVLRWP